MSRESMQLHKLPNLPCIVWMLNPARIFINLTTCCYEECWYKTRLMAIRNPISSCLCWPKLSAHKRLGKHGNGSTAREAGQKCIILSKTWMGMVDWITEYSYKAAGTVKLHSVLSSTSFQVQYSADQRSNRAHSEIWNDVNKCKFMHHSRDNSLWLPGKPSDQRAVKITHLAVSSLNGGWKAKWH